MEQKASNPLPLLEAGADPFLQAYFELVQLKHLYRQGWLRRGVPRPQAESVAEHSFGMAVLALWLGTACYPGLDVDKAVRMALLHELGEVYAGDIIPSDSISAAEKHAREAASLHGVCAKLPGGQAYIDLWEEFEAGETPEARFVRQLDRLEMGLQAAVYARQGLGAMDDFFASARRALHDEHLLRLLEQAAPLPPADKTGL